MVLPLTTRLLLVVKVWQFILPVVVIVFAPALSVPFTVRLPVVVVVSVVLPVTPSVPPTVVAPPTSKVPEMSWFPLQSIPAFAIICPWDVVVPPTVAAPVTPSVVPIWADAPVVKSACTARSPVWVHVRTVCAPALTIKVAALPANSVVPSVAWSLMVTILSNVEDDLISFRTVITSVPLYWLVSVAPSPTRLDRSLVFVLHCSKVSVVGTLIAAIS